MDQFSGEGHWAVVIGALLRFIRVICVNHGLAPAVVGKPDSEENR